MYHFKKAHESGHHIEMFDPSSQYLHTCSPIGTPRAFGSTQKMTDKKIKEMDEYRAK